MKKISAKNAMEKKFWNKKPNSKLLLNQDVPTNIAISSMEWLMNIQALWLAIFMSEF